MKKERFTAYRDTDYMYVSALARAKERGIIGKDGLSRMIDSEAAILAEHGYVRDGYSYRVTRESHETLAFFCHYGVTAVLLSHLLIIP